MFIGLWIGLPGCVEEFDQLAKSFFKATGDEQKAVFEKVQTAAAAITDEKKKLSADVYVKTMQKILEKGKEFVETELTRVDKLGKGKLSEKKKAQLKNRSNILMSFKHLLKDEL